MPDQLHWDTRLEIKVDGATVSPIDSITPTFNVPIQVLHSVEADNVGYVVQPQTFTFTMTVKAIGPTVAKLTDIARTRTKFNVAIAERKGHDWSFNSIAFSECLITSVNPSNVVIDGVPTASFNCISLGVETEKAS